MAFATFRAGELGGDRCRRRSAHAGGCIFRVAGIRQTHDPGNADCGHVALNLPAITALPTPAPIPTLRVSVADFTLDAADGASPAAVVDIALPAMPALAPLPTLEPLPALPQKPAPPPPSNSGGGGGGGGNSGGGGGGSSKSGGS